MSAYTDHAGAVPMDLPLGDPVEGIRYRLTRPLVWAVGHEDSGLTVEVPAGFIFDVSVPRAFRWIFDPHDVAYHKAAALHDWMLADGWSRVSAAAEFHQALDADGVSAWRRAVMLLAVQFWRYR